MNPAPPLFFLFTLASFSALAQVRPDLGSVEALVVQGTNDFRQQQGRTKLERDDALDKTARAFAEYMARTGEFSHEAGGGTPSSRTAAQGYDFCLIAENVSHQYGSAGFPTAVLARRLVDGWKNSSGHRKNMLDADVIHTGLAVAYVARKGLQNYYAVQLFARPKSANVEFHVSNPTAVPIKYRVAAREFVLQPRAVRTHTDCTPDTVVFQFSDETKAGDPQFTTRRGDRFTIARDEKGQLSISRE